MRHDATLMQANPIIMWEEKNGKQYDVNLSALDKLDISEEDEIETSKKIFKIDKIIERRKSSLTGRDHIKTVCSLIFTKP